MVERFAKRAEDIIIEKMVSRDKKEPDRNRRLSKVTGVFDLIRYAIIIEAPMVYKNLVSYFDNLKNRCEVNIM